MTTPAQTLAREPEAERPRAPLAARLGSVAIGGALAALACSAPGAVRAAAHAPASRALELWIALAAIALPLAVVTVGVLSLSREGLRIVAGERARQVALAVIGWALFELVFLSAFGAVLRRTTHQRSLAGVTFAAFAVAVGFVLALFARRATTVLARAGARAERAAWAAATLGVSVALVAVGARLARAEDMHAGAGLLDAVLFVAAASTARRLGRPRWLARTGVPLAALVLVLGLALLRADPSLRESLAGVAPLHALLLAPFAP